MNKELQSEIFAKFPKLFDLENKTAPISVRGIETPEGWNDLVGELCRDLQEYVDQSGCTQVKIAQLKNKMAGLRCYLSDVPQEVGYRGDLYNIVGKYQSLSYLTCESCGTSDKKHKVSQNFDGWILTLCEGCRVKREKK